MSSTNDKIKIEMPSHFSRDGKSPDLVLKELLEKSEKYSEETRKKFDKELCVKYGEDDMESFDCFYPENYKPEMEVVLFIHGGYWQEGNNALHHYIAEQIVRNGKVAVFLDTQNAPDANMSEIMKQCRRGLTKIIKRFRHTKRITISGHSSGAHKAFMTLAHDWSQSHDKDDELAWSCLKQRLANIVLLCGVYELEHLLESEVNEPLQMSREEARENSPLLQLQVFNKNIKEMQNCRIAIVHTEYDAVTIKKWNSRFIQEMKKLSLPNMEEIKLDGHDHFSMLYDLIKPDFQVTKLLVGNEV